VAAPELFLADATIDELLTATPMVPLAHTPEIPCKSTTVDEHGGVDTFTCVGTPGIGVRTCIEGAALRVDDNVRIDIMVVGDWL